MFHNTAGLPAFVDVGLVIPHPRITERAFVLVPLAEIRPNLTHPSWTLTVTELLESLTYTDKVEKIPCSKPYLG